MDALQYQSLRYGEHSLQTIDVWERPVDERVSAAGSNRYFFIYIHGGAWRDPRTLTDTAVPSIKLLMAPDSQYLPQDRIAGFASIGYRLSPHPDFPQDVARTPADELHNAKHPDHIDDVWAALAKLAETRSAHGSPGDYIAHDRYIVYGHSCGAFLTYQLWMGTHATPHPPPAAARVPPYLVGFEGIYDLRGLVDRGGSPAHGGGPGTGFAGALQSIAEGAFGTDRAAWDTASPGRFDWTGLCDAAPRRLAVVAYSMEDELVDVGEIDTLEAVLRDGERADKCSLVVLRDLHGKHDDVHIDGHEIARVLTATVRQLDSRS